MTGTGSQLGKKFWSGQNVFQKIFEGVSKNNLRQRLKISFLIFSFASRKKCGIYGILSEKNITFYHTTQSAQSRNEIIKAKNLSVVKLQYFATKFSRSYCYSLPNEVLKRYRCMDISVAYEPTVWRAQLLQFQNQAKISEKF